MTTTSQSLATDGAARVDWIRSRMRMLAGLRTEFAETQPFAGRRIGMSLHIEPKTAVLLETLAAGGAEIIGTGNHGSTQDDVVAHLRSTGMTLFGARADTLDQHEQNIQSVLDSQPEILLDNGADLAAGIIAAGREGTLIGGTEETTSGANRLRGELAGQVPFPVIVINDSLLKQIGENKHAVGQSVVESFMRITNLMVPGRRFLVVGYGWCGRGVAQYLRALGGKVAVAESDELKGFEAAMDGFRVDSVEALAPWAEVVITATGFPGVLPYEVIQTMADDAILANCGHFPWEIDVEGLNAAALSKRTVQSGIERFSLPNGRNIVLLAEGRMFNLAGDNPKGNSLDSMDLGFLLQTLSLERVATGHSTLSPGAQPVPIDLERRIARTMLSSMGAGN